jgi:TRAP-type C4-dicarboxylate transport system permease small subunit
MEKWEIQKGDMDMSQEKWTAKVVSVVAIFVALALIFAILLILARFVLMDDTFAQTASISVGSALLGGGVAFFLIEIFSLWEARKGQTTEFKTSKEREPVLK